jgi:hypothetical protein
MRVDSYPKYGQGFRPTGASPFIGGLELWFYVQVHWFSGSFRLQAFGVVLLVYWILGAMWYTRDRGEEPESAPP